MLASGLIDLSPTSRRLPRWMLGRRTTAQFLGILILSLAGFALSGTVMERTWEARSSVTHTRDVQLQIDRIVWDLLSMQQSMQAFKLSDDPDHALRFERARTDIRGDILRLTELTADNASQRQLLTDFETIFAPYFAKLEYLFAFGGAADADRARALAMSADAVRMSAVLARMREHEDGLLKQRSARAETLLLALLPTLSLSAALVALLLVMLAQSIKQSTRDRELALVEKAGELAAKDMLMREVDHRAHNSLGLIYNLMTFQQQRSSNTAATREFLAEAANQVLVVARMHERLYQNGDADALPIGLYLRDLCEDVATYSLPAEAHAAIRVQASDAVLPAEQAVWLGLIVVELVTNAMKYGAPSVETPIMIDIASADGQLQVSVSDGGAGLPDSFDPQASKGLGMQVVCLLIRQLHATLSIDLSWSGARFLVTVPLAPCYSPASGA